MIKSFSPFIILLFIITCVYVLGWQIDIMDVDATQYATISREMFQNKDYLHVFDRGQNYLDKPPLVFWCTTISYSIFGVNNFAFKLPHFIFCLISLLYTFRLAKLFYGQKIAQTSVLILASTQAIFLMNHDCRMDMALTAGVIMSVYYMANYQMHKKLIDLLLSCVGISIAMLAKGPLGLMIPVLAFSVDFIAKRNWKAFYNPNYLIGITLICLLLLPMCVGLYEQYGNDGLLFYFWKQSFGRITGDNDFVKTVQTGDHLLDDPTFFYHTFLWSFAPWSILFVLAFILEIKSIFKNKFNISPKNEVILIGGFILTFTALSYSKYKLPHYIFELYPFAAILTAKHWLRIKLLLVKNTKNIISNIATKLLSFQLVLMVLLWLVVSILALYSFQGDAIMITIMMVIGTFGLCIWFGFLKQSTLFNKTFYFSLLTAIAVNFILNAHVYPQILKYQYGGTLGRYLVEHKIQANQFLNYTNYGRALDFYAQQYIPRHNFETDSIATLNHKNNHLLMNENQYNTFKTYNIKHQLIQKFEDYPVTLLTLLFLNPATRNEVTNKHYFVKVVE